MLKSRSLYCETIPINNSVKERKILRIALILKYFPTYSVCYNKTTQIYLSESWRQNKKKLENE